MSITEYSHHNMNVSVVEEFKGKHKDICICHQGCLFFAPKEELSCNFAKRAFGASKEIGIVLVMECKHYRYQPPFSEL